MKITKTPISLSKDQIWIDEQINLFSAKRKYFIDLGRFLNEVFTAAAPIYAPYSIVQHRIKDIASFAEKILRKSHKYKRPLEDITDLCGVRIITHTSLEVAAISRFIEDTFEIDKTNSIDASQRLSPAEFGYRSIHYIVTFRDKIVLTPFGRFSVHKEIMHLKAEIQVRTLLEHAWADIAHELVYKTGVKLPMALHREFSAIAATLEHADSLFTKISSSVSKYVSDFSSYMPTSRIRNEMTLLLSALKYGNNNISHISKVAKLALSIGDWDTAISILEPFVVNGTPAILRDYGISLCKKNRQRPSSRAYRKGQHYLEKACNSNPSDIDALSSLAGTWKKNDTKKSMELYQLAHEIDPFSPYPLGNLIECALSLNKKSTILNHFRPLIRMAIAQCKEQINMNVNLPWAFFDLGKLNLLIDQQQESINAYLLGVENSTTSEMIKTSFDSICLLEKSGFNNSAITIIKRLLLLSLVAKSNSSSSSYCKTLKSYSPYGRVFPKKPIVLIAGGCSEPHTDLIIKKYRNSFLRAFNNFSGIVIAGGTKSGVNSIVGDIGMVSRGKITTIGYAPGKTNHTIQIDKNRKRYSRLYYTNGTDYSQLETIQAWIDILNQGVKPSDVKMIGVDGGIISAFEYRLALSLGASVGIIFGSGREADIILADPMWAINKNLIQLSASHCDIADFINKASSLIPRSGVKGKKEREHCVNTKRKKKLKKGR